MAEPTTSSGTGATPTPDQGATPTPAPGSATGPAATLSLEEAMKRIADLEHSHGNAREELDRHRKKLSAYEKAEQEAKAAKEADENAQLAEIDQVKKQHAKEQTARAALEQELREVKIQHAVERAAHELNFHHPEVVSRLLNTAELEYENGSPTNVRKLVEKLAKTFPELVKPQASTTVPDGTQPPAAPTQPGTPALPAMNPGRTAITAPNTLTPGKPVRLSDIQWSR